MVRLIEYSIASPQSGKWVFGTSISLQYLFKWLQMSFQASTKHTFSLPFRTLAALWTFSAAPITRCSLHHAFLDEQLISSNIISTFFPKPHQQRAIAGSYCIISLIAPHSPMPVQWLVPYLRRLVESCTNTRHLPQRQRPYLRLRMHSPHALRQRCQALMTCRGLMQCLYARWIRNWYRMWLIRQNLITSTHAIGWTWYWLGVSIKLTLTVTTIAVHAHQQHFSALVKNMAC